MYPVDTKDSAKEYFRLTNHIVSVSNKGATSFQDREDKYTWSRYREAESKSRLMKQVRCGKSHATDKTGIHTINNKQRNPYGRSLVNPLCQANFHDAVLYRQRNGIVQRQRNA